MKSKLNVLLLFVFTFVNIKGYAQCTTLIYDPLNPVHATTTGSPMVLNVKTDFCAVGDGVTDDHQAFKDAATFIRARGGYAILIIPDGVLQGRPPESRWCRVLCPGGNSHEPAELSEC